MRKSIQSPHHSAEVLSSIPTTPKALTVAIVQALALQAAQAATIEVTSNLDNGTNCTLREAVTSINNSALAAGCSNSGGGFGVNDTITFAPSVSGSTIALGGSEIQIEESVSINPGGNDTTISGADTSRIFYSSNTNLTINLDHLVLTNGLILGNGGAIGLYNGLNSTLNLTNSTVTASEGDDGGGLYAHNWVVNLTDSTISGNSANDDGGGLFGDGTTIGLTTSTVSENTATDNGGGLYADNSTITLTNSTVSGNSANDDGGGLFGYFSTVNLANSTVSGNTADDHGGGLFGDGATISLTTSTVSSNTASGIFSDGGGLRTRSSSVNLTNSTVSDNTATDRGGGLNAYQSTVNLTNSIVSGNTAGDIGGGLWAKSSTVNLTHSTVSDNSAYYGGGLSPDYYSTMNLTRSTVLGNTADSGGGIWVNSSALDINASVLSINSASSSGGGLYVHRKSTVSLTDSTVSGNTATSGGGLVPYSSTVALTNTTVSGNTATNVGGIYVILSEVALGNSTVSDNASGDATKAGGVYVGALSTLTMTNSIIANSLSNDDCERNIGLGVVTAGNDSIIEVDNCGTSAQMIDPGLLPLAANGGPTETHALMPGSPAIDGGNNLTCETTDQRGETRDDGICDIGAYEFNATLIPIARKDRKMGAFMNGGEQWYSFNSTESQKLSMQTNGFSGDTLVEFYTGSDPKQVNPQLNMDDDSGPDLFSNIKHNVNSGPHLIRVKSKTDVIPYWLRLMSDQDILSFGDTASHFANKEIRVMSSAGITGGCGVNQYCPTDPVTRAQMAIFMLKAILGGNHSSPAATGTVFNDVSTSSFGANFIEEFSTLGITSGCGGGKYCPDLAVTREQMAVFLLRAWYGSSYTPPTATPAEINQFSDIANSFARDWIVQLTKENITGGCGGGKYCPTDTVTRGQMAAFITRTFSLDTEL